MGKTFFFFFLVWYISNIARKDERGKEEWFYFLSITETACVNKFQFLSEKKKTEIKKDFGVKRGDGDRLNLSFPNKDFFYCED